MKKAFCVLLMTTLVVNCFAVTSQIIHHKTIDDFSKGKTSETVVSSRGNITLAKATETLCEDLADVWIINSILKDKDGSIYLGTSPNGEVFKYKNGKTECIYPVREAQTGESNDTENGSAKKHFENLHVFKIAFDDRGELLAAISGEKCSLVKIDGKKIETVFEPNNATYIFDIETDAKGNIFLATGPNGHIWQLDKKCQNPQLIYTCNDKNVMSLAMGKDGYLYAGTDSRGLVYKIDADKKTASVLYDSDEDEITDLLFDIAENLYAAATSYGSIHAQMKDIQSPKPLSPGRPENNDEEEGEISQASPTQGTSLKIPNTGAENPPAESVKPPMGLERGRKAPASHVYKIDTDGFVTDIFSQTAVFFTLYMQDNNLLLGTGNKAELYSVNPQSEIETLIYADQTSSQITDIIGDDDNVYFCTANPAKLILLKSEYSSEGNFESALIDAGQPAQWGKLQLDADIPDKTKIMLSARSGNVDDMNDQTYSPWTKPIKIDSPVNLVVPQGRFCQYKLILSGGKNAAPLIREVATAFVIPNLAPRVTEVTAAKPDKKATPGIFKIDFKALDENNDQLVYKIDFRKMGRSGWIELTDELDKPEFEWDSRTVEDGIYEIRVTASDELSNNQSTRLAGARISESVTVDNTPPAIQEHNLQTEDAKAILKLKVKDQYSVIESLSYTVDSNEKWLSTLPQDNIFDTTEEDFIITTESLTSGRHVLAIRISDIEGNRMYKTFDVEIK